MKPTAFVNDDELTERSFAALEKLGVSPSEALRQTLEYVVALKKASPQRRMNPILYLIFLSPR
ncbi:type II toxin-antitoxin system RelB/DinJ family antitoxin [Shewanella xiamenensis]|uniref:type II toxin-antitoxin system RelB/DinJ family antitoxin n=1 Tax=Shewanella xiamenensis TaxID=332186 RepID=UPI002E7C1668|nr:type II toxin-antitoxin system RelB/DinJ family antitoxin [Shewanella xiamenensis]MEE1982853.1 type II toxin-antitoxin system RelB/DinJ family antitoxin [Shewanella xiamenensis]